MTLQYNFLVKGQMLTVYANNLLSAEWLLPAVSDIRLFSITKFKQETTSTYQN